MLDHVSPYLQEGSIYYANWDILLAWIKNEPFEVAIVGDDSENFAKNLTTVIFPMFSFAEVRMRVPFHYLKEN